MSSCLIVFMKDYSSARVAIKESHKVSMEVELYLGTKEDKLLHLEGFYGPTSILVSNIIGFEPSTLEIRRRIHEHELALEEEQKEVRGVSFE